MHLIMWRASPSQRWTVFRNFSFFLAALRARVDGATCAFKPFPVAVNSVLLLLFGLAFHKGRNLLQNDISQKGIRKMRKLIWLLVGVQG